MHPKLMENLIRSFSTISTSGQRPRALSLSSLDSSPTTQAGMHSELFWMENGTIILELDLGTQFCVHKTMLSWESTIFKDIFELFPPVDEQTVDGCHIVHLSNAAQEVEILLKAVYDHQ